jgi:hypothetical protein
MMHWRPSLLGDAVTRYELCVRGDFDDVCFVPITDARQTRGGARAKVSPATPAMLDHQQLAALAFDFLGCGTDARGGYASLLARGSVHCDQGTGLSVQEALEMETCELVIGLFADMGGECRHRVRVARLELRKGVEIACGCG